MIHLRSPRGARRSQRDAGNIAAEFVLLLPVFLVLLLAVGAMLYVVNIRFQATGAARDAARAGSLERSYTAALAAAEDAAAADLAGKCDGGLNVTAVSGLAAYTEGGLFTVQVDCTLTMAGMSLVVGETTVRVTATAGLDTYRRIGD